MKLSTLCQLAVLSVAGCTIWSRSSIQLDYRAMMADIQATQIDDWAQKCAPEELALALANQEFATLGGRAPRRGRAPCE